MGRLTIEERNTIIELHKCGHKPAAIVKCFKTRIDTSNVYKLIAKYNQTGKVTDRPRHRGSKFTQHIANIVTEVYGNDRFVDNYYFKTNFDVMSHSLILFFNEYKKIKIFTKCFNGTQVIK